MNDLKLPPLALPPADAPALPNLPPSPIPAGPCLLLPKTMLTHELIRDVCEILRLGNFRMTAAQRLGIPYGLLCRWIKRGHDDIARYQTGDTPSMYAHFAISVDACEADCESAILEDVIHGDTKAKIWFLEHRHNKKYTRNTNVVIDDAEGTVVRLDPLQILADRLRELKERMDTSE